MLTQPARRRRATLDAVAQGARSRAEIARLLGISPSTATIWVNDLLTSGDLEEAGEGASRGGRRPTRLRLPTQPGHVVVADLGTRSVRLAVSDLSGRLLAQRTAGLSIADGPDACIPKVVQLLQDESSRLQDAGPARAIGVSLPGPVDPGSGTVNLPSRMPGWSGVAVRDWLSELAGLPASVDNDANLMALAEHRHLFGSTGNSITVKASTAIGSGIIIAGRLYRGGNNAAGDFTHTSISEAGDRPCSCGKVGCLETVASGQGIVRLLTEAGVPGVETIGDALDLARNADPLATTLIRSAGGYLGDVLSNAVGFLNPDAVVVSGGLASSEHFLTAVKSRIYAVCHPLVTQHLRIEGSALGESSGLIGAALLAIDEAGLAVGQR